MPRSVPDDDMMDEQQTKDLGHPTKHEESPAERIARDMRANRGLGTLAEPREKDETKESLERATDPSKR
ncbi:hypothetical protein [Chelativorans sp. J32]|uniref:hypothetical protein n=1 Tax=Chelativorans sp. J32 TaxID=935840 RepID=UPI00047FEA5B|nr:hypothetical protein [Chelativorans sp. J32]